MAISLADYDKKAKEAVQAFWGNREKAKQKQIETGRTDAGQGGVLLPVIIWMASDP